MRPIFVVEPQRCVVGGGWQICAEHRATRFAVIKVETAVIRGEKITGRKLIGHYRTIAEARAFAEANRKSHEPTPRHKVRKLGRRIIADPNT